MKNSPQQFQNIRKPSNNNTILAYGVHACEKLSENVR